MVDLTKDDFEEEVLKAKGRMSMRWRTPMENR